MIRFASTTAKLFLFILAGTLLVSLLFGDSSLKPNVILVGLAVLALAEGALAASIAGFVLGVVLDSSVPNLLGLHALTKTLFGYGLGIYHKRMIRGVPLVEGLTIAAFALAHDALYLIVSSWSLEFDLVRALLLEALPSALLTGILAVPVFRLAELSGIMHREN